MNRGYEQPKCCARLQEHYQQIYVYICTIATTKTTTMTSTASTTGSYKSNRIADLEINLTEHCSHTYVCVHREHSQRVYKVTIKTFIIVFPLQWAPGVWVCLWVFASFITPILMRTRVTCIRVLLFFRIFTCYLSSIRIVCPCGAYFLIYPSFLLAVLSHLRSPHWVRIFQSCYLLYILCYFDTFSWISFYPNHSHRSSWSMVSGHCHCGCCCCFSLEFSLYNTVRVWP